MLWAVFAGILFIVTGALLFLKPELLWRLTEKWKSYRADEPSDLYRISTKFGGILYFLLGIAMIIVSLWME